MSILVGTEEKASDISFYNITGKLGEVGRAILIHAVHEMRDGHDVQEFLCASRCTQEVISDELFPWSIARVLSEMYLLCSVPLELTDIVWLLTLMWLDLEVFVFPLHVD